MSVEIEDKNDQQQDALIEKLVSIRRVTKVVKGGRVMTFSALTVVGDGNGRVGFGSGKAREVPVAIKKQWIKLSKQCVKYHYKAELWFILLLLNMAQLK